MPKKIKSALSPSFVINYDEGCSFCAVNNPYSDNIFGKFGTFSHDMLETNTLHSPVSILSKDLTAHQDLDEQEEIKRYSQFIAREDADYEKFMNKARNIVTNYNLNKGYLKEGYGIWDTESRKAPAQHVETLYGSKNLSVKIFPGNRRMRGKMDRIDYNPQRKIWLISDYKTGKGKYTKLQLTIYNMMFRFAYGITDERVDCRYIFIEEGEDWVFTPTEQEIMEVYKKCLRVLNTYLTGLHAKKPSYKNCMFCKIDCDKRRGR